MDNAIQYTFAPYDVLQIRRHTNSEGWQDFSTLRTPEEGARAVELCCAFRWEDESVDFRIIDSQRNVKVSVRRWGNYLLQAHTEYGHAARRNRGSYTGQKIHCLRTEYVVGVLNAMEENARPGATLGKRFFSHGRQLFSAMPMCACTQGQRAGSPGDYSVADVTCQKCLP